MPFGRANAATDSVSGRVWAATTSCPAHRAFLRACPLCKCVVMCRRKPNNSECDRMSRLQIFKAFPIYTLYKGCVLTFFSNQPLLCFFWIGKKLNFSDNIHFVFPHFLFNFISIHKRASNETQLTNFRTYISNM
jgi:hypothetical protein